MQHTKWCRLVDFSFFVEKPCSNDLYSWRIVSPRCLSWQSNFLLVWLITAELYPTNLRSQAVGTCSTIARVFGLVAPFVAQLAVIWKPLPMLILGFPSIVAACLTYFIPETKHIELPTTMKDASKLENNKLENKRFVKGSSGTKN